MSDCLYCGGTGNAGDGYEVKKCGYCKGTGCNQSAPFKPADTCPSCNGRGKKTTTTRLPDSFPTSNPEIFFVKCGQCAGTGRKP